MLISTLGGSITSGHKEPFMPSALQFMAPQQKPALQQPQPQQKQQPQQQQQPIASHSAQSMPMMISRNEQKIEPYDNISSFASI